MATGRSNKLTADAGKFLVAAELCRRDLAAAPLNRSRLYYNVSASGTTGGHIPIQVSTANGQKWQFSIDRFAEVQMENDGKHQRIGKGLDEPCPGLICVLVALGNTGHDSFFILEWKKLQRILMDEHEAYLRKHGFIRPRKPDSFHCALEASSLETFRDKWGTIRAGVR